VAAACAVTLAVSISERQQRRQYRGKRENGSNVAKEK